MSVGYAQELSGHRPHRWSGVHPGATAETAAVRAWAWLRQGILDGELASGEFPHSALLRRRASVLTSLRTREAAAREVEAAMVEAEEMATLDREQLRRMRSDPDASAAFPVQRDAVLGNVPALVRLVHELRGHGQVSPQGVALTLRLLGDGASPLYCGGVEELGDEVREASEALHFGPMLNDAGQP